MTSSVSVPRMSAAVVFSTRFGNTEKVAKSLESGLTKAGLQTICINADTIAPESLKQYDVICVGGPTEASSASKPIKHFLQSTRGINLAGKLGFAFDTKLDSRLSGSAAKYIEHALDDQGLHIVSNHESAIVTTVRQKGAVTGAYLKVGEEERFKQVGFRVGTAAEATVAKFAG